MPKAARALCLTASCQGNRLWYSGNHFMKFQAQMLCGASVLALPKQAIEPCGAHPANGRESTPGSSKTC